MRTYKEISVYQINKKRDNAEIETELKKYAEEIANLDHRMLGLRNKIEKI